MNPTQFPKQRPAPQPKVTHDPQNQVLCPVCGGENLTTRLHVFRQPGMQIGTVDCTMNSMMICEMCREPVDISKAALRKEIQKFEDKPA